MTVLSYLKPGRAATILKSKEFAVISVTPPARRVRHVSVQSVGLETLVYDEARHKAFCLNPISALVWRLADGRHDASKIAEAASVELKHLVTEEIVLYALGQLQQDGLLECGSVVHVASRRELVKKLGYGAAMLMPVVTAVFAPKAAEAYGGGCVLPNTPITLPSGATVAAGLVNAEMWVRGVDPGTGLFHDARVVSCHRFRAEELLTFFTETGECVQSSPSHLFLAGRGDVEGTRASAFRVGESLMVAGDGGTRMSVITAMERSSVPQEVVIFELDTVQHCFLSAGVVSHNMLKKQLVADPSPAPVEGTGAEPMDEPEERGTREPEPRSSLTGY